MKYKKESLLDLDEDAFIEDNQLEPQMSWFSGMCLIMGLMIGSGIFSTPSDIMQYAGSPGMAVILWFIGGVVSLCGAFCYVELGTMLPQSGGEQTYLNMAYKYPRYLLSFLFCWSMILLVRPGAAAADCIIFAKYLLIPFYGQDQNDWIDRSVGFIAVTLITIMNIFSTRMAILIHDGVTVIKVGLLALVCVTGILVGFNLIPSIPRTSNWDDPFGGSATNGGIYASALFAVFYSFDGWNNLNYSVGELKDPKKNLPKAAGLGVSMVVILYVVVNMAYINVIPMEEFKKGGAVLASTFFTLCFGEFAGSKIFPVMIALSAFGSVCAMVFSASRVIHSAAVAGYLPYASTFSQINSKTNTPVNALLFSWVQIGILMFGPPPGKAFEFLVQMIGYPTWLFYGITVVGLILMRKTEPYLERPFRVSLIAAIVFVCCASFLIIFPFVPKASPNFPFYLPPLVGVAFILAGIPFWHMLLKDKTEPLIQ